MTARLIAHLGFHKTGTKSVQKTLQANRDILDGHLHITLRADMHALCEATRAWSASRKPVDLAYVRYEAAELLAGWQDDVPMLISSEDLSGHMPGRRGLTTYDAAPQLAEALVSAWTAARPDMDVTLVYTTRAPDPWLRSCHTQHLRAIRIKRSAQEYADTYARSADFDEIIADVRRRRPDVAVEEQKLEQSANLTLGPLDPILDLTGLPPSVRTRIRPQPRANVGMPQAARDAVLALNRSDLKGDAYRAARKALKKQHG
ncbi:sulfotransferase [uncultured Tateyamaria sp.]|uniref:sulfotransferase n=1 Tax=uncultured Tateyamaria sp. TaxID=455651 RepID=UPI00260D42C7|nr:sulfotransferase [uncultured Tateyamaria sp.]